MRTLRILASAVALAALASVGASAAQAEAAPSRPIIRALMAGSGRHLPHRVMPESPTPLFVRYGTPTYIGVTVLLAGGLAVGCHQRYGWPSDWPALGLLAFIGALTWWLPSTSSDGLSHFTADNVVVLAAIPIVGPVGAGVVGLVMAALTRRRIPAYRRAFNMAMASSSAMVGGLAYDLAGGSFTVAEAPRGRAAHPPCRPAHRRR